MGTCKQVKEAADYIKTKIELRPKVAIICGSGLSGIGELLKDPVCIPYKNIPHFVQSNVEGHKNRLLVGCISGKPVVCMQGRFHPYEGHEAWLTGFPPRVFRRLGCQVLIATNSAGGLNKHFQVGDFMIVKDHISFLSLGGYSPLVGKNEDSFGPRFPSMLNVYDVKLRKKLTECVEELDLCDTTRTGVYAQVAGPSYETVAELKMLRCLGADVVGMSTVQEVIAARHCGMRVVAMTLVTNVCAVDYDRKNEAVNHEEVLKTAERRGACMRALVKEFIAVLK